MTFDALIPEGRKGRVDEGLFRAATEAAKDFAGTSKGWLVFSGKSGAGKTHLAASIVNLIIERGSPAKYVSALDIPDLIRNEQFEDSEGGTFTALLDAPVLVIDDLGAQRETNWIDSKIDQLLTYRFNARMPTVVVLAKAIEQLPERIALKLDDPTLSEIVDLGLDDESTIEQTLGIPSEMTHRMMFENFDPDGANSATSNDRASIRSALKYAREFVDSPDSHPWLYLHGPTGVGKTHLAVAVAVAIYELGGSVVFWTESDLLDVLRMSYSRESESDFYPLFDEVRNEEILILDDFGQQSLTDWALEKLYQLISYRHDRRLKTVITSQYILWKGANDGNWGRLQGKQQWESICSRLNDSTVVTECLMAAPDYRNRGA